MFSLDRKTVKLVNVNPRAEKHGDENALACDLKFEIRASNDVLSEFHHSLKSALYKEPDQGTSRIWGPSVTARNWPGMS